MEANCCALHLPLKVLKHLEFSLTALICINTGDFILLYKLPNHYSQLSDDTFILSEAAKYCTKHVLYVFVPLLNWAYGLKLENKFKLNSLTRAATQSVCLHIECLCVCFMLPF